MKNIKRTDYIKKIEPFIGKQIIKVLTGQRRVGKSYILLQILNRIKERIESPNIIYINMELEEFLTIKNHRDLLDYVNLNLNLSSQNFLFIDEIQEIESFQLAIRSLFADNKCEIFCTGSNAKLLSGELATELGGRYIEFRIHSLGYKEFLAFHAFENSDENLVKYLKYGGMPFLINLDFENSFDYLQSIYSTILLKDVVSRENIRNVSYLENLVKYIADNVGNLFSSNNISKFLKSQNVNISPQQTLNYLKALCNAFFIHKCNRTEIGGLKIFEIGEKYYFEDIGLRNAILGFSFQTDIHKLIENVIAIQLLRNNYTVYVGKLENKEIDFVAEKNGIKIYIQVCLTISDTQTRLREFGNLLMINDNYSKYVITYNDIILGDDYKGIKQMNLKEFLYNESLYY